MKRFAKILALVLLVVIVTSVLKSSVQSQAASSSDSCPVLGNNLIDNIDVNVLINLRQGFKNAGGSDSCTLTETFLLRSPDIDNKSQLAAFFQMAQLKNIHVIIRVADDGGNDASGLTHWNAISVARAIAHANALNDAIGSNFSSGLRPNVVFGNEVNFPVEWGDMTDDTERAKSYAESFIAFAENAKNFNVVMAPLSLSGPNPQAFWAVVFATIKQKIGGTGINSCSETLSWINSHVYGFALNLYTHSKSLDPSGANDIVNDFQSAVGQLSNAWAATGCKTGSPVTQTHFVITEFGIQDGAYVVGMDKFLLAAYKQLISSNFGSQIVAVTSFVWEKSAKKLNVHGFYYLANGTSGEYYYPSLNLGGSTSHGSSIVNSGGTGGNVPNSDIPIYPPLGSLQICPPEIAVDSKFGAQGPALPTSCGIPLKQEPAPCKNPTLAANTKDFCSGINNHNSIAWCDIKSCAALVAYSKNVKSICYSEKQDKDSTAQGCAHFTKGFCDGEGLDPSKPPTDPNGRGQYDIWQSYKTCKKSDGTQNFSDDEKWEAGRCQQHYIDDGLTNPNKNETFSSGQSLPVCVPTYNPKANCVTECGEPIKVGEQLRISQALNNCLRSESCRAQIALKNKEGDSSFSLPFVAKLNDYFLGVLDAEHQSSSELDRLQNVLKSGVSSGLAGIQEIFDKAGVARKLLPAEIQDKLKCSFINYVQGKKTSGQNTKYLERIDGKLTGKEFMIYDKKITDFYNNCRPTPNANNAQEIASWDDKYGKYWFAIPLFQNDDAQGEIQFVSPSVFSTLSDTSSTGQGGNKAKFGPVYVSIPEIQRLATATALIQSALVPQENIDIRQALIKDPDPAVQQKYLPTYGKVIDPKVYINACGPKDWNSFYGNSEQIIYDATKNYRLTQTDVTTGYSADSTGFVPGTDANGGSLTEYSRAVECIPSARAGDPDSKICTIGPFGELRCSKQDKPDGTLEDPGVKPVQNFTETVQVRTVFPNLFDIAEQTIGKTTGLLRIFKPGNTAELNRMNQNAATGKSSVDQFEKNYDPIPASTDNIHYYLPTSNGLSIDDTDHKDKGWKVFFYKLGGLWNARNFVLELLNPGLKK